MRIHTFNGKQYIALGDFNWLRQNLIMDIRDSYEKGVAISPEDMGAIGAYSHIMVEILKDQLHAANEAATDAKSLREGHDKIYDRMRWEWAEDKWMICATDKTQGGSKGIYFARIDDEDGEKETPVFTDIKRKAYFFDDYYNAKCMVQYLEGLTKGFEQAVCDIRIEPAWVHFTNAADRLLDAIFGEDNEAEDNNDYCIFLAPEESDDHDAPMWFSQWIKYSDDLPQPVKNWLEQAHVEPGESAPMFSGGNANVMRFKYKGMAEKTAEKIGKMYPDLSDRLHVMVYEDKTDDDLADGIGQAFSPD